MITSIGMRMRANISWCFKTKTYLEFIESGEPYTKYPRAAGRRMVFYVMAKFALSEKASKFYRLAEKAVQEYGCALRFVHYKPNEVSQNEAGKS